MFLIPLRFGNFRAVLLLKMLISCAHTHTYIDKHIHIQTREVSSNWDHLPIGQRRRSGNWEISFCTISTSFSCDKNPNSHTHTCKRWQIKCAHTHTWALTPVDKYFRLLLFANLRKQPGKSRQPFFLPFFFGLWAWRWDVGRLPNTKSQRPCVVTGQQKKNKQQPQTQFNYTL